MSLNNCLGAGRQHDAYRIDARAARSRTASIYRALGRHPENRYSGNREFKRNLEHLDEVGVEDRVEIRNWQKRKSQLPRNILYYASLAVIPVVILPIMVIAAHRR